MDEKITVIIPVFNGEKYIKKALNSLFNQTFGFENIEVIVVDNCSTDNTAKILKDFDNNYENIKCFFLEKNSGTPGKGRNIGIQNASTDYIMFLDSDDEFALDMCEVMYSTITSENVDFVFCRYDEYLNNQFLLHDETFLSKYGSEIKIDSITEHLDIISACNNLIIWNKIYNKEFITSNDITFIEDGWNEDLLFSYEVFLSANNFISLNNYYGYKYHIHSNSSSHSQSCETFLDGIFSLNKLEKLFEIKNFKHFEVVNDYIILWTQFMFLTKLSNNQKKYLYKQMKPYYKRYNLFYRLVNWSLPFNMIINVFVKLFSLSESFAVLITNIFQYLKF